MFPQQKVLYKEHPMAFADALRHPLLRDHPELDKLILHPGDIASMVKRIGQAISVQYQGQVLYVVGVANGGLIFQADLLRYITGVTVVMDIMGISSYGTGTTSSGQIDHRFSTKLPLDGQQVLLVEDLVDTGQSLQWLVDRINLVKPASLRVAALLDKQKPGSFAAHYVGTTIADEFVVGYGMDYRGMFANLPFIATLKQSYLDSVK